MAHPHVEQAVTLVVGVILDVAEQARMTTGAHSRVTELALRRALDLPTELHRHGLHAVADAEHRHAEIEHAGRRAKGFVLVDRLRASRQDHAARIELANSPLAHVERSDLAIDLRFTHTTRDELGVLRAEVEDENAVGVEIGARAWCAGHVLGTHATPRHARL